MHACMHACMHATKSGVLNKSCGNYYGSGDPTSLLVAAMPFRRVTVG